MQKHKAAQARLRVYAEAIKGDEVEEKPVWHTDIKGDSSLLPPSFPNVRSQPFFPSKVTIPTSNQAPQASVTQTVAPSSEQVASFDLVKTLTEAITANKIPIPEPGVFTGDPLQYNDWKLSFQTLVDRKNLPIHEHVGGSAKKAIEGHFLVATDAAYHAAWETHAILSPHCKR